jgi:diketogulonate reductase-like aldo/keto reductase
VSAVGQGTWYRRTDDRATAIRVLRRGLDLGLTHIDTAEMYGNGAAEKLVGEAIAGRRHEVFLVSKVLPEHASRWGAIEACEQSLERLKTDHLDCYLLHWRGEFPLRDTVNAFLELQQAGKILSWGVSNFDVADLADLWKIKGGDRAACNQVLYNLGHREIEHAVIPWCEQHGPAVVAYSPFHRGSAPNPRTGGYPILAEIAAAHGATVHQVALRFLLRRPQLFVIPKAANPKHVEDNAGAMDIQLTDEEIAKIDQAFPLGPRPRELPTL